MSLPRSEICARRTAYFDHVPEQRAINRLPDGPLPHVYGSRTRTTIDGVPGPWSPPRCSWCGKTLDRTVDDVR